MVIFKRKKKEDPPIKSTTSEINYDNLYKEMLTFILKIFGKWNNESKGALDTLFEESGLKITCCNTDFCDIYTRVVSIYLKNNFIFSYKEETSHSLDFFHESSAGHWSKYLSSKCKKKMVNKIYDLYQRALAQQVVDNCKLIEEDIKRQQELQKLCEEL